jgi:DNA-binding response OmpR family regulator
MRQSPGESPAKGSILIVEDDAVSSSALRTILTRLGWQVTEVPTIGLASSFLARTFDVVILDLMLPDGDGMVILERIRRMGGKCRVVITTGVSDPDRLKKVTANGPDLLLVKPIDLQTLMRFLDVPRIQ